MSDQRTQDAGDPTYPDAERCAQTLENCEDDLLTEAAFVRWQGREIERLRVESEGKAAELANLQVAFNDWKVFHSTTRLEVEIYRLRAERDEREATLRAALVAAMAIVQQDRVVAADRRRSPALRQHERDDVLALYDAVIAQADKAMGSEG